MGMYDEFRGGCSRCEVPFREGTVLKTEQDGTVTGVLFPLTQGENAFYKEKLGVEALTKLTENYRQGAYGFGEKGREDFLSVLNNEIMSRKING